MADSTLAMKMALAPGLPLGTPLSCRSMPAFTSVEVTGAPSEYFRFGLSLSVAVRLSAEYVIPSASSGFGTPFLSWRYRAPWTSMIVSTDTRSPDLVTSSVRTGPAPATLIDSMVCAAARRRRARGARGRRGRCRAGRGRRGGRVAARGHDEHDRQQAHRHPGDAPVRSMSQEALHASSSTLRTCRGFQLRPPTGAGAVVAMRYRRCAVRHVMTGKGRCQHDQGVRLFSMRKRDLHRGTVPRR